MEFDTSEFARSNIDLYIQKYKKKSLIIITTQSIVVAVVLFIQLPEEIKTVHIEKLI